ncbi:CCKAR [Mytilus edulis]|uniref:CCKAR n=1 Tax=Mytilus edulis TaxID=6550 RepID=A0A8S3QZR5_MYTED|nr:CCKAR [Mytilus edulis]
MYIDKELESLNYEKVKQNIGGIFFVSIAMVIGITGNLHVLCVYSFRMKQSNPRIFILFLAALDFITCAVGMPFIIIDLTNPLTFYAVTACKVLRFVNYFICLSSAFILLIIAIDRYRKVCLPLRQQISQRKAVYCCFGAFGVCLVFTWPAPVLYGYSTVNTTNPNVTGIRCFTEDIYKDTDYQAYFNVILILVMFGMFVVLVVLYALIAKTILENDKNRNSFQTNKLMTKGTNVGNKNPVPEERMLKQLDTPKTAELITGSNRSTDDKRIDFNRRSVMQYKRVKTTTLIMFLITVLVFYQLFPASYSPNHYLYRQRLRTKNEY